MNRKRLILAALAAVAFLQTGSLAYTVAQRELALSRGERFLFRAAPVDPYDAFRGRYVELAQEDLEHSVQDPERFRRGQRVSLPLSVDAEGFARMGTPSPAPPADGRAWVQARVMSVYGGKVRIRPPFSRFYMQEKLAPRAEEAVRRWPRTPGESRPRAWIAVRLRNGIGVIEDLFVEGKSISEFLAEQAE